MRAGVGLIGLLLAVALIFYLMFGGPGNSSYVRTELETRDKLTNEVNAISGKDAQGARVTDALTYSADSKGIVIQTVAPGSAYEQRYGIRPADVIIELGPQPVREIVHSDADARDWMMDAYQRSFPILVMRDGKRVSLPQAEVVAPAMPMVSPAAPVPSAGTPQPQQQSSPTRATHDLIDKIQTH